MTKDEALKLALEALECALSDDKPYIVQCKEAITTIKEALAQPEQDGKCKYCTDGCHACDARKLPEQEPVAWVSTTELLVMRGNAYAGAKDWRVNLGLEPQEGDVGLYTTPPQRTWVGLTDKEIDQGLCRTNYAMQTAGAWRDGVDWAIKQLKERNA